MFNSSVNNKRHRTLQERLGGQASSIHRTNAVQISVPSRNNRDTTTMNSNNINNILVEQLKQDNANLSNRLANCEQQIGQLTSQLQIVCNTLEQLQQEPASSSVLTKHSIDHRKDIKAIGKLIRSRLVNLPEECPQFNYQRTFMDKVNKPARLAMMEYGRRHVGKYPVSDVALHRILSDMFNNKKRELKMLPEQRVARNTKNATRSIKDAKLARRLAIIQKNWDTYPQAYQEDLEKLMIVGWMSDEEEADEKNPDGSKVIKVMRPSFRSERFNQLIDDLDDQWRNPEDNTSGKVQRNNRLNRIFVEGDIAFPRHLNEADFPAWAFNS